MPTRYEIATTWALWCEYVDPHAVMTREEFDALSVDERLAIMRDAFD